MVNAGLADPGLRTRLEAMGASPIAGTPGDFARLISDETEKVGKVIEGGNLRPT